MAMSVDYGMNRSLLLKTYKNTGNTFPSVRDHDEGRENAYIFFVFPAIKTLSQFQKLNFTSADAATASSGM
jgi:hypothetical protein